MKHSVTLVFDKDSKNVSRCSGSHYSLCELEKATRRTLPNDYLPEHIRKLEAYKDSYILCCELERKGSFVFFVIGNDNKVLFRLDIVNGFGA